MRRSNGAYRMLMKERGAIDKMMGYVAVIGPLSASPQVLQVYIRQEAQGVSLLSWVLFLILAIFTLAYGVVHHLRPIILSQSLWIVIEALLVSGIIMYGSGRNISLSFPALIALNNIGKAFGLLSVAFGCMAIYFFSKSNT